MMEPSNEAELADAIRDASGPLRIRGGGTRPIGVAGAGEVLSTTALSGVTLYEPGALTIVVKAGTPLAEVQATLAAENQRLPFEPMDHRSVMGSAGEPTIGGVVAANVSGPRRIQAGACRDALIGVRFVDGSGTALKNGGRVMKNVTGYDLVKLMAGCYGTLGVLSEVSFKLLPGIAAKATLSIKDQGAAEAVATMSRALGSPFEVSGAAHLRGETLIRIEGLSDSVAYRSEQLAALLGDAATIERDPDVVAQTWEAIGNVAAFAGSDRDVWRMSVKPSDAPVLIDALPGAETMMDWGGGLVWASCAPGTDLRAVAPGIAGHRTLVRASEATKQTLGVFQPEPAPIEALNVALRAKFDPRGILNPGLMG